jgi:hypothetical protein
MVMGPFYSSNFNYDLVLVLLYLIFDFFSLFILLSSVSGGFLFLLLGPRFVTKFLHLHGFGPMKILSCITDVKCFVNYSIQFPNGPDYPGVKSYILSKTLGQVLNFQFMSPVWSQKMLANESIKTETTTSRGCKYPCVFI